MPKALSPRIRVPGSQVHADCPDDQRYCTIETDDPDIHQTRVLKERRTPVDERVGDAKLREHRERKEVRAEILEDSKQPIVRMGCEASLLLDRTSNGLPLFR